MPAEVGATEPKHERKKQVFRRKRLMKVEKSSFLTYFFSASAKKVRKKIILIVFFLALPQKVTKKGLALGKITYPSSA
jgi:hypothetical protein